MHSGNFKTRSKIVTELAGVLLARLFETVLHSDAVDESITFGFDVNRPLLPPYIVEFRHLSNLRDPLDKL